MPQKHFPNFNPLNLLARLRARIWAWVKPKPLSAAEAWLALGGNACHTFWMFAHPVNLLLGRDNLTLLEPAPLLVSSDDAKVLLDMLNQHFSMQNMHFYLKQNHWFLGLDADPKITTTALKHALNKDIAAYAPIGEGALAWASIQNEVQMLLFAHTINTAREARGELPINSLWFDGLSRSK